MSRLTIFAKGARKLVVDNAPMILTGIAVAGVATTAIMAVKVTPAATEKIYEAEVSKGDKLSTREVVQETWMLYLPAAAVGIITVSCVVGANHISNRRTAALAGAYSLVERNFSEYQEYVKKEFGAKKEQAVQDQMAEDKFNREFTEDRTVIVTGDGDVLCCDTLTNAMFESNVESIRKAVNDTNYLIINDGYASMNDFYDRLGIPRTEIGEELGWTMGMPLEVHFTSILAPGNRPALAFRYSAKPIREFYRFS